MQINISILTPSLLQLPLFSSHIRGTQAVYKHKPSKSDNMRMDLRTEKPIAPTEIKARKLPCTIFFIPGGQNKPALAPDQRGVCIGLPNFADK